MARSVRRPWRCLRQGSREDRRQANRLESWGKSSYVLAHDQVASYNSQSCVRNHGVCHCNAGACHGCFRIDQLFLFADWHRNSAHGLEHGCFACLIPFADSGCSRGYLGNHQRKAKIVGGFWCDRRAHAPFYGIVDAEFRNKNQGAANAALSSILICYTSLRPRHGNADVMAEVRQVTGERLVHDHLLVIERCVHEV